LQAKYEIVGYLDNVDPGRKNESFGGAHVLGGQEQLLKLQEQGVKHIILAVGQCDARLTLSAEAQHFGFARISAIHPSSTVAGSVVIGSGTVIVAGAVVNPAAEIGNEVIINTCASVDHECVIEDGVHVGPGAHLACRVRVGCGTFIGVGATIKDRVRIGRSCVIGAGSVVLQDLPDGVTAYGVPARIVRYNK